MAKGKVPKLVAGGLAGPGSLYSEERMLAREGKPRNPKGNAPTGSTFKKGSIPQSSPEPTMTMAGQMSQVKQAKRIRGSRVIRPPKVKI